MNLYEEWENSVNENRSKEEYNQYWTDYFKAEAENYKKILSEYNTVKEGKLSDLADEFHLKPSTCVGFMDGINSSLADGEIDIQALSEESYIKLKIDFEKLFFNMHVAKADWLYNLKEWEEVLPENKRKEITKEYHESLVFKAAPKIGRNDPCPCGSGKKYKKCCGK